MNIRCIFSHSLVATQNFFLVVTFVPSLENTIRFINISNFEIPASPTQNYNAFSIVLASWPFNSFKLRNALIGVSDLKYEKKYRIRVHLTLIMVGLSINMVNFEFNFKRHVISHLCISFADIYHSKGSYLVVQTDLVR